MGLWNLFWFRPEMWSATQSVIQPKPIYLLTLATNLLIDQGLAIGVGVSLVIVLYSTTRPYCTLLGRVGGSDIYRDIRRCADAHIPRGIRIFRFHARLYFANMDYFEV
jgi:SulP family sulfate permease